MTILLLSTVFNICGKLILWIGENTVEKWYENPVLHRV